MPKPRTLDQLKIAEPHDQHIKNVVFVTADEGRLLAEAGATVHSPKRQLYQLEGREYEWRQGLFDVETELPVQK